MKLNPDALAADLGRAAAGLKAYRAFALFLIVAVLYGFIVWRINIYSTIPADQSALNSSVAVQPHIDPTVVQKLQNLQDNSVGVQTLFSQSRQNPFQE